MKKRRKKFEFDVALSFAGENRAAVKKLAAMLRDAGVGVFYDEYERAKLWGKDLYQHLHDIYENRAKYCVVFVSKHYIKKHWAKHELKNAQARAFASHREYILPLRMDSTVLPGLPATVGYIDLKKHGLGEVAVLLLEKLNIDLGATSRAHHCARVLLIRRSERPVVNEFAEYMELIVEPTFEDFSRSGGSVRHAYLACLAIYHAVDRAAYPGEPSTLAEQWRTESMAFMLVEEVAQHFKHGRRGWVEKAKAKNPDALLITHPLGLEGDLKGLETRSLYFQARDAVLFLREKAKLVAQGQAPSSQQSP